MNNYDLIDEILAKAAPDSALPEHVRREMRKAKKTILVNILKNAGTYTAFTALVINAVLLSKKIGLGVSAVKVQIAVKAFIAVTASTAVVSTGAVAYKTYVKTRAQESIPVQAAALPASAPVPEEPAVADVPSYRFVVLPFECASDDPGMAAGLSKSALAALQRSFGDKSAAIADPAVRCRSTYTIRGSCARLGANWYLSVRLMVTATSRIVTIVNRTVPSAEDLAGQTEEIISEISALKLQ